MKAKVSERALVARIRRALAKNGQALRACRADSRWFIDFGAWYIVDQNINAVLHHDIDLEDLGRELGVMADHEELSSE